MLSVEETQQYLTGAWRLMMGKPDGLKLLDISADGFWNSFFAIAVAFPALVVGWVGVVNDFGVDPQDFGDRFSILIRLAVIDCTAWIAPLALLAVLAPRFGILDRFVHYVVANNWGSALVAWLMLPSGLLRLFVPEASASLALALAVTLFVISMALTWRLTNAALGKGPGVATAVFGGMFAAQLAVLIVLQALLGLAPGETPYG